MLPVVESKIRHIREQWAKVIENLRRRRDLPVKVSAGNGKLKVNRAGPYRGIRYQGDCLVMECETNTAKPEFLCVHHEICKVGDRKVELVEELNSELLKERSGHVRENGFQESTDTHEAKVAEVKMNDMCRDRRTGQLPLEVTIRNRRAKADVKSLQLGQE